MLLAQFLLKWVLYLSFILYEWKYYQELYNLQIGQKLSDGSKSIFRKMYAQIPSEIEVYKEDAKTASENSSGIM